MCSTTGALAIVPASTWPDSEGLATAECETEKVGSQNGSCVPRALTLAYAISPLGVFPDSCAHDKSSSCPTGSFAPVAGANAPIVLRSRHPHLDVDVPTPIIQHAGHDRPPRRAKPNCNQTSVSMLVFLETCGGHHLGSLCASSLRYPCPQPLVKQSLQKQ